MKTPILFALALIMSTGNLAQEAGRKSETSKEAKAVPSTIDFQGRLHDSSGSPVNATLDITFSLYELAEGGTPFWMEEQTLEILDGLFQVKLGSIIPLETVFFGGAERWLGITVMGSSEMSPRTALSSVAYALQAEQVNLVTEASLTGQGTQVSPLALAPQSASPGQVLKWDGGSWIPAEDHIGIELPFYETAELDQPVISVTNLGISGGIHAASAESYGVWGESMSTSGMGVYGRNIRSEGNTMGVRGHVESPTGYSGYFQGARFYVDGNTGLGIASPTQRLDMDGQIRIRGGNPGPGKVLTSDAEGTGSWETAMISLPFLASTSEGTYGISITHTAATGTNTAGFFESTSTAGTGLFGLASANNGNAWGVHGESGSVNGAGVFGHSTATSGENFGVMGISESIEGAGVLGANYQPTGVTYGVRGMTSSDQGYALFGLSSSSTGATCGVFGQVASKYGTGVFGENTASEGRGIGVYGKSDASSGYGVYGEATNTGSIYVGGAVGVFGKSISFLGAGVAGYSSSSTGRGVSGFVEAISGINYGISGISTSTEGKGVYGEASAASGITYGVQGVSASASGYGAYGHNTAATGITYGVFGKSDSNQGRGVWGLASSPTGVTYAVVGRNNSNQGTAVLGDATTPTGVNYGIFGKTASPAGYAGYFQGQVYGTSKMTMAGGNIEIDHPSDPENRILRHSLVEAPERMNVYSGNVNTDETGKAVVILPGYFESFNTDFRYQLTVIGTFAQAIIGEKIHENRFTILTDKPHVEVSWQVTGVRTDAWARQNPVVVEEDKTPDIRGYYLQPGAFGQPENQSAFWGRNPEWVRLRAEEAKAFKRLKEHEEKEARVLEEIRTSDENRRNLMNRNGMGHEERDEK
jgi:hypothetical protein